MEQRGPGKQNEILKIVGWVICGIREDIEWDWSVVESTKGYMFPNFSTSTLDVDRI